MAHREYGVVTDPNLTNVTSLGPFQYFHLLMAQDELFNRNSLRRGIKHRTGAEYIIQARWLAVHSISAVCPKIAYEMAEVQVNKTKS